MLWAGWVAYVLAFKMLVLDLQAYKIIIIISNSVCFGYSTLWALILHRLQWVDSDHAHPFKQPPLYAT